jgi:hypothetical protein
MHCMSDSCTIPIQDMNDGHARKHGRTELSGSVRSTG